MFRKICDGRSVMARVISLIMALMLVMAFDASMLGKSYAEEADQMSTIDEIAEQFGDPNNDPYRYTTKSGRNKALKLAEEHSHEKIDLRDLDGVSYVTPVKFQNPWNNCWGFAAIAAAETSILGDSKLRGNFSADIRKETDPSGKVQMDLSEKHLSYFSRMPINDPNNPQNGEGNTFDGMELNFEETVNAAYELGGHAPTATSVFAAGMGPVLESEDPVFEYKGRKGTVQSEWVGTREDGKLEKSYYSSDDDWVIDESLRFVNSYTLKESYVLPSPAKISEPEEGWDYIYEYDPAGVEAIKEQIRNKRGVQIGYKDDTFNAAYSDHGKYINSNFAQYTYYTESPKHAVCIVGFDDDYPKENFRHPVDENDYGFTEEDTVPPDDGAWLVKNSWGSGEEDFPNKGEGSWGYVDKETGKHTGYFWLSYYDQSIATPEALAFENDSDPFTNVIDQYDFLPIGEYLGAHVESEVRSANVFKAGVCEEIKKVSCETSYPGTEVTFEVYLLARNYQSPTDGILMDTVTPEAFKYGGFHKVSLNKPFTVMRGQSYSIVVTQRVPEDDGTKSYGVGVRAGNGKVVVNAKESWLMTDGKWQDFSDESLRAELSDKIMGSNLIKDDVDNFPIKGYGEEKDDIVLELDGSMVTPEEGQLPVEYLKAWITDRTGKEDFSDVELNWHLADGGDEVIDLTDGRDPSRKTVQYKKHGWTFVTVSVEGIGQAIFMCRLGINAPYISKSKAGNKMLTLTFERNADRSCDGYEIQYRIKGEKKWSSKYFPAADTIKLTGLKNGKRYEVRGLAYIEDPRYGRYFSENGIEHMSDVVGLKNTLKATGKTVSVKSSDLKNKALTVVRKKAIKVSKAKGKVTYAKKSGDKKITVNKKNGNITVKKGLKKGTYKVKVTVTAAGKGAYLKGSKTATVTIRVK